MSNFLLKWRITRKLQKKKKKTLNIHPLSLRSALALAGGWRWSSGPWSTRLPCCSSPWPPGCRVPPGSGCNAVAAAAALHDLCGPHSEHLLQIHETIIFKTPETNCALKVGYKYCRGEGGVYEADLYINGFCICSRFLYIFKHIFPTPILGIYA